MTKKIEKKILPNPDLEREQCVDACKGCEKMFSDENIGDVCIPFLSPLAKWKNYIKEDVKVATSKTETKIVVRHHNYCPMATHLKHVKIDEKKIRVGQQKTKRQNG